MENDLDAWAQELREAGCCLSGFTLKVKALEILRKLFILNESKLDDESDSESSELDDESDNSSSDDEEPLDKNGKRGTCGGTEDEAEDDDEEEEEEEEEEKEKEESDDKTDSKVAQEVRKILNSLDLVQN